MVAGDNHDSNIAVELINQSIIKAADVSRQPYILPLSNLDHLMGGFPVTIFYAYRKPSAGDFHSIVSAIRTSLAETLSLFYPFAGRIVRNSETGEAEILCNNEGIKFMEAAATVPLATLDFHDQNQSMRKVLVPFPPERPLSVQVTGYTCGGFSVAWCFDHLLADATAFVKFLNSWSETARTKQAFLGAISHDRSIFRRPRSPPVYSPLVDRTYTVCTLDDILTMPPNGISEKHLYYVEGPCLERLLQEASSNEGSKRTRLEALSAYLWKAMARARGGDSNSRCKMGWMVDGRRRMVSKARDSMPDYIGNVVSIAVGEESSQELKDKPLSHVARIVSGAIGEVAREAHFLDLIDWIECHRPAMMLPELLLGVGGQAVVVSACHNMPVMSVDFGFGRPSLGTFYSTLDQMGAGYVNLVSSGKEDGGWFASTLVWRELAEALESDPDHIFQPITADLLRM